MFAAAFYLKLLIKKLKKDPAVPFRKKIFCCCHKTLPTAVGRKDPARRPEPLRLFARGGQNEWKTHIAPTPAAISKRVASACGKPVAQ